MKGNGEVNIWACFTVHLLARSTPHQVIIVTYKVAHQTKYCQVFLWLMYTGGERLLKMQII